MSEPNSQPDDLASQRDSDNNDGSLVDDNEIPQVQPDADDNNEATPVQPKKRGVRKLVVLNTERLKGPKGVHTIEKLYQGYKFHGKGNEKKDLDSVMKKLEYWAYRLFPKLEFDDFLTKCETLGHKKDLQVHLKKYRLRMIDADYTGFEAETVQNELSEEEDETMPLAPQPVLSTINDASNEIFDRLLAETATESMNQQLEEQTNVSLP